MTEFEERTGNIEVPKNTGIDGFLHTVRQILEQHDYVQRIEIDSKGLIRFKYYAQDGQPAKPFNVDFEFLEPDSVIRNGQVQEVLIPDGSAASTVIGILFEAASRERMYPVAFASGSDSVFWDWHFETTGIQLYSRDTLYGLPFLTDRHIPDTALLLCTAFGKGASLIDTQVSYKISMGFVDQPIPHDTVDIL